MLDTTPITTAITRLISAVWFRHARRADPVMSAEDAEIAEWILRGRVDRLAQHLDKMAEAERRAATLNGKSGAMA
jgi:hypothetical protein